MAFASYLRITAIFTVKMHIIREMCDVETIIVRNDRCLRARTCMSFKECIEEIVVANV